MWKPSIVFVFIAFVLNFNCFGVYAIVCPENVCANSQCDEVNESICSGEDKVIKKGGFCGCCDTCFTLVGSGEYCGLPLLGLPPPSIECKEGLSCIGGFCVQRAIDVYK